MVAPALADVLKDFGSAVLLEKKAPLAAATAPVPQPVVAPVPMPNSTAIEDAVAAATAELAEKLKAEHAAEIEALREAHSQEIARLQAEIGERAGDLITTRFGEMEARLVELTSSVVARILGISLTESVQEMAVASLAEEIGKAVKDREAVTIRVHGPLSLFETLQSRLGKTAEQVEYSETSDLDLTVAIDDALFETRLSDWSAALAEIMA